jgi:2-methylcitrate dehydratase PrpD
MALPTVLEKIARHLWDRATFSPLALSRANDAILDTYAVMLAGANEAPPQAVKKAFSLDLTLTGPSAVVGESRLRASPAVAAMINGTAAHSLDFDDNFHPARSHASAVLIPALLSAAGISASRKGSLFLSAYLCGLEAQAAVGFGLIPSHYNIGWHATSTVGCIGTAAGVARLIGTTELEMAHAMSIAVSLASGPKGQFGTMVKPFHAGVAAKHAIEAVLLAKAGMQGRLDILEGKQGFLELCGGSEARGWNDLSLNDTNIIETRGVVAKRHPCCGSTHRAIDALLDLKNEHSLKLEDIETINAKVGISAYRNLSYPAPRDEMEARFSMQYCLAAAFQQDLLRLSDFTPVAVARPNLRPVMERISMSAYTPDDEKGKERLPHIVSVTTKDGRELRRERLHAKGAIEDPLDADDLEEKFLDCLKWGGRTREIMPSWKILQHLEKADDILDVLPVT